MIQGKNTRSTRENIIYKHTHSESSTTLQIIHWFDALLEKDLLKITQQVIL